MLQIGSYPYSITNNREYNQHGGVRNPSDDMADLVLVLGRLCCFPGIREQRESQQKPSGSSKRVGTPRNQWRSHFVVVHHVEYHVEHHYD